MKEEPRSKNQEPAALRQQRSWFSALGSFFACAQGRRFLVLGGLLTAVFGCIAAGSALSFSADTGQAQIRAYAWEHTAALRRWEARPFSVYRMALEDSQCYMDLEVRNEHAIWAYEASCERKSARTVSDLLRMAAASHTRASYCLPAYGCACELVTSFETQYDPQFGYPTMIRTQVHAAPDRLQPDYWRYLVMHLQEPDCSLVNSRTIRVLSLTPLR